MTCEAVVMVWRMRPVPSMITSLSPTDPFGRTMPSTCASTTSRQASHCIEVHPGDDAHVEGIVRPNDR